jgi:acyl carrier protein
MGIEERIINVIKNNIDNGESIDVKTDSRLIEDLRIDSFDKLMIISAIEDEFSITIEMDDTTEFLTVNDIIVKLKKLNIE